MRVGLGVVSLGLSEFLSVDVFLCVSPDDMGFTIMPRPTEGIDALRTEAVESSKMPM